MRIKRIDHFVITVKDIQKCTHFYEAFGFDINTENNKIELISDNFKINVHLLGKEIKPNAKTATTGTADFCLEVDNLEEAILELKSIGIVSISGIVERSGRYGSMQSAYFYDPDGNLVELCQYA